MCIAKVDMLIYFFCEYVEWFIQTNAILDIGTLDWRYALFSIVDQQFLEIFKTVVCLQLCFCICIFQAQEYSKLSESD